MSSTTQKEGLSTDDVHFIPLKNENISCLLAGWNMCLVDQKLQTNLQDLGKKYGEQDYHLKFELANKRNFSGLKLNTRFLIS